jgi:uncharacterized membrane protein required for colicin V production
MLAFNWVDLAIVTLLTVGLLRGRRRGMSEELLDTLKWTVILILAAVAYEPTGKFLATSSMFSLLSCYVAAYLIITLMVVLFFAYIRARVGDKIMSADTFGGAEYYLGMMAGAYRYTCIILVAMAFLNARYYSPGEIQAQVNFQQANFGDIRFPTLGEIQHTVFDKSLTGRLAQDYLYPVLIRPTAPEDKGLGDGGVFRRRSSEVNDILEKR